MWLHGVLAAVVHKVFELSLASLDPGANTSPPEDRS